MVKMMAFADLLNLIDEDPITGAQEAQKRNEGVRNMNYQSSVSAGALYRRLNVSPQLISGFYGLSFWAGDENKKSYLRNPKHLNKHCHQFVYGARDGRGGKRAEDHAYATQTYLDDEKRSLEDLLEALKSGGFDGLKKPKPVAAACAQPKKVEAPMKREAVLDDTKSSGKGDDDAMAAGKPAAGAASEPPRPTHPKIALKKVFEHLLIAMEPDELAKFLADESDVGDAYHITVERDADDAKGMLVWRAVVIAKVLDEV